MMMAGPVLACTTHSFGIVPLAAAFRIIRALEIDCADLIAATYREQLDPYALAAHPDAEAERIGDLAADTGVTLSGCFVGFKERFSSPDPADCQRRPELFEAVARFCRHCGIAHLQAGVGRAEQGRSWEEQLAIIVENVRAVQKAVGSVGGVKLLLEAQRGAAVQTPAELEQLLEAMPDLQINHDPGQFACQGFDQTSYEALYPRTAHIHMRQARPGALQTKLEEGTVDFARVIQGLHASGFTGVYATEYVHFAGVPDCSTVDVVTETVKMRDLIQQELQRIGAI